jgi:hypothetical protein
VRARSVNLPPMPTVTPPAHSLNLADRLFLLLDGIGAPAQIFVGVELDGRLEAAALHRAASALIRDYPKLNTRVVRGLLGYRRVYADDNGSNDLVVLASSECAFLQKQLDLRGSRGVQWLCIERGDGGSTLLMTVHHSVCDGGSALAAMERLSSLYGHFAGGKTSIPGVAGGDMPHRYREHLKKMPARERLSTITNGFVHTARMIAGLESSPPCATFTDMPLPCTGELRRRMIAIPTPDVHYLMRWAVRRRATVADALLAATLVSGASTWPQREAHPALICLPIGGGSGAGPANRAVSFQLRVPLERCKSFPDALQAVAERTEPARRPNAGIRETLIERTGLSLVPPAVFERLARGYFARRTNTRETLTFTVLSGPLDAPMPRFGDLRVQDVFIAGSLLAPPGLRLGVVAAPGKLNLCISYLYPVILESSMDRFVDGISSALTETEIGRDLAVLGAAGAEKGLA